MSVSPDDLAEWRAAIGRARGQEQMLDAESLRRFAVAIGADPDVERAMPVLGHWAWFLETATDDGIGPDGHPKRGGFLPAVTLQRRMFAAASVDFHAPAELGAPAILDSIITDVRHRAGASGDLIFVEVERRLGQAGTPRLTERQTIVYRDQGDAIPLPAAATESAEGEMWRPGPVQLFRFSAATFNGHRIHYDRPYAREVELYPDLVVHGPFTAARLAEMAARDGPLAGLEFRLLAPLFVDQPVRLARIADSEYHAIRCDGVIAASLKARAL